MLVWFAWIWVLIPSLGDFYHPLVLKHAASLFLIMLGHGNCNPIFCLLAVPQSHMEDWRSSQASEPSHGPESDTYIIYMERQLQPTICTRADVRDDELSENDDENICWWLRRPGKFVDLVLWQLCFDLPVQIFHVLKKWKNPWKWV